MNAVIEAPIKPLPSASVIVRMAARYGVDADKMLTTLKATAFRGNVTNEQMMALLVVADQYQLNPWTKEIYAFPDKNNGIVPVVGVDGWSRVINSHPQFDGMDFEEGPTDERKIPEWIECRMHRKDRSHPVCVKEYFSEVVRDVGPWKSHPRRMLRHKAMIQCARLAFGFVGVYDEDEAERIIDVTPRSDPRPDTSQVDMALRDRWVGTITDLLAQDKDEYGIAADLRAANDELSQFPELYSTVFDKLAADKIITKAKFREFLKIEAPRS